MILADANLLTRMTNMAHQHCPTARKAVHNLLANRERIAVVPRNLYEFWAVATRGIGPRPAGENGLGLTIDGASQWLQFFQRRFTLLADRQELPARWHELVRAHGIRGFRSHDARLVAAMQCYGIERLLSFNGGDFKGLPVTVVDPASV